MNKGILTIGIILLSVIALLLLNVLNNYMTGGELDYYLVKETADAALEDSLDEEYERFCGLPRMDKEKFVENFVLRFVNSVDSSREYELSFYDLNEVPPKVSVQVNSLTALSFNVTGGEEKGTKEAADIITRYSAIVESDYYSDPSVEEALKSNSAQNKDMCKAYSKLIEEGSLIEGTRNQSNK